MLSKHEDLSSMLSIHTKAGQTVAGRSSAQCQSYSNGAQFASCCCDKLHNERQVWEESVCSTLQGTVRHGGNSAGGGGRPWRYSAYGLLQLAPSGLLLLAYSSLLQLAPSSWLPELTYQTEPLAQGWHRPQWAESAHSTSN